MKEIDRLTSKLTDFHFWDFFNIMATGFVVSLIIIFSLLPYVDLNEISKLSGTFVVFIFGFYSLGIISDPIVDLFYKELSNYTVNYLDKHSSKELSKYIFISKVFNLLLSIKEGEKNKTVYEEKAEEKCPDALKEFIESKAGGKKNPFWIARTYLEIYGYPHRYLSFYSKYGFYKNLSCLLPLFFVPIWINFGFLLSILYIFFSIPASIICILKSKEFYYHACREIFKKFFLAIHIEEKKKIKH